MNDLSSTKFREMFTRLTSTTTVTVHGHVIGTWVPGVRLAPEDYASNPPQHYFVEVGTPGRPDLTTETRGTDPVLGSFGVSRPAPKPAGRKR